MVVFGRALVALKILCLCQQALVQTTPFSKYRTMVDIYLLNRLLRQPLLILHCPRYQQLFFKQGKHFGIGAEQWMKGVIEVLMWNLRFFKFDEF